MNIDRVLDRLDKVRKSGKGWIACCPAHDDRSASLAVSEADGKILLNCFAGCTFSEICGAMGMEEKEMFAEEYKPLPGGKKQIYFTKKQLDEIDLQCWFCAVVKSHLDKQLPVGEGDINKLGRVLKNLRRSLPDLLEANQEAMAVKVFKAMFLFSSERKQLQG